MLHHTAQTTVYYYSSFFSDEQTNLLCDSRLLFCAVTPADYSYALLPHLMNLPITRKPATNNTKNARTSQFKYLSINIFAFAPTKYKSADVAKNLKDLPIMEASTNIPKLILHTPAAIVNTLYGIGVNAAAKTARKALSLYSPFTFSKFSRVNCAHARLLKKKPRSHCHNCQPMKYPNIPPSTEPTEQIKAYLKALFGMPSASAINKTSGGMGKNDDSTNAKAKSA